MGVTVGLVNAQYVEIVSGLNEGDQVIYKGYDNLKEGDPVVPTAWGNSGPLKLPPATGEPVKGTVYTCPMHPEVRSDKPGDCPKCGMRLVPVEPGPDGTKPIMPTSSASPRRTASGKGAKAGYYTCPMHPEVRSDRPGKCPKCGMDLVFKPATNKGSASGAGGPP